MIYLSLDYLSQRIEVSDSKIEKKKKCLDISKLLG